MSRSSPPSCLVQRSSVSKVKCGVKKKAEWERAWRCGYFRFCVGLSENSRKKGLEAKNDPPFLTLRDCTMFLVLSCWWKLKPSPKNMSDKSDVSSPISSYSLHFCSSERISYASEINFHCVHQCNVCMVGVVWARGREGERHTKWHMMYTSLIPRPHRGHGVWQDAGCYLLWIVPLNTAWSDITGWSLHDTYMHP